MKKAKKNLFSFAVTAIAAIIAIQVSTINASPRITLDVFEPNATVVKAAAKANEAVAVAIEEPVEVVTTKIVTQVNETAVVPTQTKEDVTQPLENNSAAAQAGSPKTVFPGIILDEEKNILYGPNDKGLLYTGFDYDLNQKFFYASLDPWQRIFGYNDIYDTLAPVSSIYFKTRNVCFNYGGLDWMIKLWKGQYGITSGAEVGIYTKSPKSQLQYDCAGKDNYLLMDLTVLKGDQIFFTREAQMHWWQTGFVMGGVVFLTDLTLKSTITFKDQEMTDAFVNALKTQDEATGVKYVVNGISVGLTW
ncbi:MAG: DUF4474 domain-containing protein [Eubacteriales bacterium]